MGKLAGNVLSLVSSRVDEVQQVNEIVGTGAQVVQIDRAESSRIKALESELAHLRCMLDQMVRQKTALLERRLSIMESCNSTLGENYHRMHRMYLDLLIKTQV